MKELLEDRITKRIKKVMVEYEPDYSPLAWESLKKQLPVPESQFKKLLRKHRLGFFGGSILGVLIIVYMITNLLPVKKNSAIDQVSSEPENYFASETAEEIAYSEKLTIIQQGISDIGIGKEKKDLSSNVTPVQITDSFLVTDKNNAQNGNTNVEMREKTETDFVTPVIIEVSDFGFRANTTELIPIESEVESTWLRNDKSFDKTRKLKFNWPDFNFLFLKDDGYYKVVGPNKFAFFYSPEIHRSDSLKTLGVSQGFGISFEGPIRSLVSVSVGLSYQSADFHKTIFSEKIPPHLVLQPSDTNRNFYYLDSIGVSSGSYKFLEIPVAVNFKFIEMTRSQVWLSAGISSIAFLRQEYYYEIKVDEDSKSSSATIKKWGNVHPLASMNFGLLYRYNISDRYLLHSSIQYKQHLTPFGYNSMKLNRINLEIGLIYQFGRQY
jgi:hypothetical protein